MLRVTSGLVKGKKLKSPNIEGFRAVQDKVKLAIFAILGEKVLDAEVLDLYAGSGNLGIEALSRGAKHCDFVDTSREAERTIAENLRDTRLEGSAEIFGSDAIKFVANTQESYDIIFADPFFKETHFRFLFENLQELLRKGGVIFFSHGKEVDVTDALANAPRLKLRDTRKYGRSAFLSTIDAV